MLNAVCARLHNYFPCKNGRYVGDYTITDGIISPPVSIQNGQYFRIKGSVFNDGIHKHGEEELKDETEFHGFVELMSVPNTLIGIIDEMKAWQSEYGAVDSAAMSPYTSESFGGYSYTKGSGSSADGSDASDVVTQFWGRLKVWYKPPGLSD